MVKTVRLAQKAHVAQKALEGRKESVERHLHTKTLLLSN
jgi:hypothetical protein